MLVTSRAAFPRKKKQGTFEKSTIKCGAMPEAIERVAG